MYDKEAIISYTIVVLVRDHAHDTEPTILEKKITFYTPMPFEVIHSVVPYLHFCPVNAVSMTVNQDEHGILVCIDNEINTCQFEPVYQFICSYM